MSAGALISVVIPAWNEQAVLPRALAALTSGAQADELEVIVVCNGCTDGTRDIAQGWGAPVRVVEIPRASKPAALRAGDLEARGFPRFYVDADVVLPLESVRAVAAVLDSGEALIASPRPEVDAARSSWAVRAYYSVWEQLPYFRDGPIGSGVYAVSERGRTAFDTFPDFISDDGWMRLQFDAGDRESVDGSGFRIVAPRTLASLIRVKIRRQRGKRELRRSMSRRAREPRGPSRTAVASLLTRPCLWGPLVVYAVVTLFTGAWVRLVPQHGADHTWSRDETSREPT